MRLTPRGQVTTPGPRSTRSALHRCAVLLAASSLAVAGLSSCSSSDDASKPSDNVMSSMMQEEASPLGDSRDKVAPVIANLSDEEVRANFPGGKFLNCELGEDFFTESYVDVGYQTVSATKAEGVENRQFCIGFATPEGDQGSAYMEMRTTEHPAIDEAKTTSLRSFDEPQLAGWQYIARDNESGTRVCAVYGPEKTPLEHIYITSIGDCTLVEPLVRNLHDLALRYQESTGEAAPDSAYIGPGDRPQVNIVDARFSQKTQGLPGLSGAVTADVDDHKKATLEVKDVRISSDPQGDLGRVCADIDMTDNGRRNSWAPTENLYVMTGSLLYLKMKPAGRPGAQPGKQRTMTFCTEAGVLYANADIAIGLSNVKGKDKRIQNVDGITPLWKARITAEGSQLSIR